MRRGLTWPAFCAALAALAVVGYPVARSSLDWQAALALSEPWRLWTSAFVHWSGPHLVANLLGCAAVGAFGWAAGARGGAVLAWLAAWPLAHAALAMQPTLARYGGLSGVLHAGVAVAAVGLLAHPGTRRHIGAAVLAGLALKIVLEQPWRGGAPLAGSVDATLAPLAHATGAVAGSACALLALWWPPRSEAAA